jgi:hypothetical protein
VAKPHVRRAERLPQDSRARPPIKPVHRPLALSFRYADVRGRYCLSCSEAQELPDVVDCLRQLTTLSFLQVMQTGGRGGGKVGLGYTPYRDDQLRGVSRPAGLDPDVQIAGVRATERYRIFGAHIDGVFYLLWFDRNHDIVAA